MRPSRSTAATSPRRWRASSRSRSPCRSRSSTSACSPAGCAPGRHRALRRRSARALCALPPHRGDLRGHRHDRVVPALPRPASSQVARDHGAGRRVAHRVLGHPVLHAAPLPHRHGLRAPDRLREHAVPVTWKWDAASRRARHHRPDRSIVRRQRTGDLARAHVAASTRCGSSCGRRACSGTRGSLPFYYSAATSSRPSGPRRSGCRLASALRDATAGRPRRTITVLTPVVGTLICIVVLGMSLRILPGWPHGDEAHVVRRRAGVQLARPDHDQVVVRRRLGQVELLGLRGQARVRRVPRRDEHDEGDRRGRTAAVGPPWENDDDSSTSTARRWP